MNQRLTPAAALLLIVPPLLWAGNSVAGRALAGQMSPMLLNFLRWVFAFALLLPVVPEVLKPASGLWRHWRRYALLGLLGVGSYNALQYLALKTSTPLNVTLVAASSPVWMLAVGRLFYGQRISGRQWLGTALSLIGVLVVLTRGEWSALAGVRLVPGDLYVLLAALAWAFYSWLLAQPDDPPAIRGNWAAFLVAQMVFGLGWSGAFAAGEWAMGQAQASWSPAVAAVLAYIVLGPAILAYRCWGIGVRQAGPAVASFFNNLTPLFAALLSAAFLGEMPHPYHGAAFALIVGGIVVSSRR
jgi:drug/metabolite transporter (DMT)-like permease